MKTKLILLILLTMATVAIGAIKGTVGDVYHGTATWYDGTEISETSQPMASGIWFNSDRMEAAHRTLRFGTVVRVTRMKKAKDGTIIFYKSATVVITDRGPCAHVNTTAPLSYKGCPEPPEGRAINKGRIIDLTPVAAEKIGMVELRPGTKPKEIAGIVRVTVEIIEIGTCWSWSSCKKYPFERGELIEPVEIDE